MIRIAVVLAILSITVLFAIPAGAQPCQQSESGLYCTQGTPQGAAPYWAELCVTEWQWDETYQGWWAYDNNPAYAECYHPGGYWFWYGNP